MITSLVGELMTNDVCGQAEGGPRGGGLFGVTTERKMCQWTDVKNMYAWKENNCVPLKGNSPSSEQGFYSH